jgi:hypothetical protein
MRRASALLVVSLVVSRSAVAQAVPRARPAPLVFGASPVAFAVEPVAGTWRWRWSLRNTSGAPAEVLTDRRLVWFEIPPPPVDPTAPPRVRAQQARRKPVRCVYDGRPTTNEFAPRTELSPGQRYSELVDLRELCGLRTPPGFSAGVQVTAHYGFAPPANARTAPRPSRVRSIAVDERPEVVNDLTTIVTLQSVTGDESARANTSPRVPVVTASNAQAATGEGLRASVRVTNPSLQPLWTLWRTVLFSFVVETPAGRTVNCNALSRQPNPLRDFFVRLPGRGSRAMSLTPSAYCPPHTFNAQGIYTVRAYFESRASGESYNFPRSFVGRVGSAPAAFRISRGDGRYVPLGLEITP